MTALSDWQKGELRHSLRKELIQKEVRTIEQEESRSLGRVNRTIVRMLIRTARIVAALLVAAFAIWLGQVSYSHLTEPLMSQNALDIITGVGGGILAILCVWQSCVTAFGSGPTLEQEELRILKKAHRRLKEKPEWRAING